MQIKFKKMKLKPIKTTKDYNEALERLEIIFNSIPGTKEGDELEILGILLQKYETENFIIELPDPIEAIKFRMEQMEMSNSELAQIIGYKSRVSEIFSKKRKLSLNMIRNLHEKLNIPYESLIGNY